ncbi:hypothetical protein Nmel_013521 [Mimus melanotis]
MEASPGENSPGALILQELWFHSPQNLHMKIFASKGDECDLNLTDENAPEFEFGLVRYSEKVDIMRILRNNLRENIDRGTPTISHYRCFLVIIPLKDQSSVITFELFPYKVVTPKSEFVYAFVGIYKLNEIYQQLVKGSMKDSMNPERTLLMASIEALLSARTAVQELYSDYLANTFQRNLTSERCFAAMAFTSNDRPRGTSKLFTLNCVM